MMSMLKLMSGSQESEKEETPIKVEKKKKRKRKIIKKGSFKFDLSRGDWQCKNQECLNINLSKRKECNKCGVTKNVEPDNTNHQPVFILD